MQKVAMIVLGAMLVGANVSHAIETNTAPNGEASENHDHRRERTRTLLSCRFVGIGIPLPPPLPPMGMGKGAGKDGALGAPGMVPGAVPPGAPGVFPGAIPAGVPGPVPGPMAGPVPPFGGPFPPYGPVPGPVVGPVPLMNNCSAVARLIDRDHGRDDDWDTDDRYFRNEFAVSCEGIPVYADTAVRTRIDGFEFLTGIVGDPVLRLVRDHALDNFYDDDHRNGDDRRRDRRSGVVPAWLSIRGRILEGFCAVERNRSRGDDHLTNIAK